MLFCVGILCRSRRDTCESRAGIPRLSDCPDMGAVVPWFERRSLSSSRKSEIFERPRLDVQTWRTGKKTPGIPRGLRDSRPVVRLRLTGQSEISDF